MFSSMLSLLGSLRGGSSFITNSLRFRSSASAYLSRTFTATPTTYTLSFWLKRGSLGAYGIFGSRAVGVGSAGMSFSSSDTFQISIGNAPSSQIITTSVYRDLSAWYHFVVSVTNNGNVVLYSNGYQTASAPAGANPYLFNSSFTNTIGRLGDLAGFFFDGYLTEVNFIDGQALTPASFGAIDSSTGVWAPRPYNGTYGTNGFYLKFADASAATAAAIGKDSSGNGNNWTPIGISVTAGATYDSMIDVPVNYSDGGNGRGNYAVLNPLSVISPATLSNGNLDVVTGLSGSGGAFSSIAIPSSGKFYLEYITTAVSGTLSDNSRIGVATSSLLNYAIYRSNATKDVDGVASAYGASFTTNDVIGVAIDVDGGTLTFYKNNVSQGAISYSVSSGNYFVFTQDGSNLTSITASLNFGQRPFTYTPPAGFRALNTNNLPTPSIVNGANFMAATTYTGNAAARSLSNAVNSVSFQPDLVWIKSRTPGATSHALFDSVRGTTAYLSSNTTTTETTLAQSLTAFGADGFSLGTDTTLVNANANLYVAWQWKAGGAAVSNTQGTITSQVSANTTAGLSVVTYTGNGVAGATIGHGLGVAPAMIIVKSRNEAKAGGAWPTWHKSLANTNTLYLDQNFASTTYLNRFDPTGFTSSVFKTGANGGTNSELNTLNNTLVAYCFAEIAGFSRFGSYTGNGLADGPFVFCGFRPRFVMIKRTDTSGFDWFVYDSVRDTFNVSQNNLRPNTAGIESAQVANYIDLTSNGFKLRGDNTGSINNTSGTYIFAAFAENPSKYALAR